MNTNLHLSVTIGCQLCGSFVISSPLHLHLIMNYFGYMTYDAWWHPLVIGIVAFCYGLYLIADMEALAFDGKHLLNNEDYVTGTLMLYLDILLYCHYFAKLIPTRNTIR